MSTPSPRVAPIVALLKERQLTCAEIARKLGVPLNVVLGVNSHFKRGGYAEKVRRPNKARPSGRTVRTDRGWTYLLVSRCGATYIGATTDLRKRLRSHNSPTNRGYTRGRQWLLLGVFQFSARSEAFELETHMKRTGRSRREWIESCLPRASRLQRRLGLGSDWLNQLEIRARAVHE